jgi:hypothetical protein
MVTEAAVRAVVTAHGIPALVTGLALPISQCNVGTVGAVSVEDAPDHREKVTQPAFFKCSPYGGAPIALTEPFSIDMGMSNALICSRGIRLKGNDVVWAAVIKLSELTHLQLDPEWPQIDILQGNRLSGYRDGVPFVVKL